MRGGHCDTNMTNITLLAIGNEYVKRSTLVFLPPQELILFPGLGLAQPLITNGALKLMVLKLSDKNEMHGLLSIRLLKSTPSIMERELKQLTTDVGNTDLA